MFSKTPAHQFGFALSLRGEKKFLSALKSPPPDDVTVVIPPDPPAAFAGSGGGAGFGDGLGAAFW
jgi:hypothetical protein